MLWPTLCCARTKNRFKLTNKKLHQFKVLYIFCRAGVFCASTMRKKLMSTRFYICTISCRILQFKALDSTHSAQCTHSVVSIIVTCTFHWRLIYQFDFVVFFLSDIFFHLSFVFVCLYLLLFLKKAPDVPLNKI